MITLPPRPGDIWAVTTGNHLTQHLIRIGEELEGKPALANHVVGVHHQDKRGRWWGIEGRPGGVGWVDLARYTGKPWAGLGNSNAAQPRLPEQRKVICQLAETLLTEPYDWFGGIAADTLEALGIKGMPDALDKMWGWPEDPQAPGAVPGHVVCSSLYAWVYARLGLPCPAGGERCEPADWWAWNNDQGWQQ